MMMATEDWTAEVVRHIVSEEEPSETNRLRRWTRVLLYLLPVLAVAVGIATFFRFAGSQWMPALTRMSAESVASPTATTWPPTELHQPAAVVTRLMPIFPTATLLSSATPTESPTVTLSPPPTATNTRAVYIPPKRAGDSPFVLQNGQPTYLANFANAKGCHWMGIAGQVYGLKSEPLTGYLLHLEGGGIDLDTISGAAPAYGEGGYEFKIGDHPQETSDVYRIQLRNVAGEPLSAFYVLPTVADCDRNLILASFAQGR